MARAVIRSECRLYNKARLGEREKGGEGVRILIYRSFYAYNTNFNVFVRKFVRGENRKRRIWFLFEILFWTGLEQTKGTYTWNHSEMPKKWTEGRTISGHTVLPDHSSRRPRRLVLIVIPTHNLVLRSYQICQKGEDDGYLMPSPIIVFSFHVISCFGSNFTFKRPTTTTIRRHTYFPAVVVDKRIDLQT